jgi:flagellar biosynthesis protein FlhA
MVDVTAGQGTGAAGNGFPKLSDIASILKRGDIALALGILTILVVLILPLPSLVLDLFLAISITLSILILMTSLFIQAPLEFSSFPTILLISTMLRLSLNLASTRLILSRGHEGTDAAGHVIEAFGSSPRNAARRWKTRAASSALWTARPNSCAATRSPACWWCSSTSSAAW